MSEQMEQGGGNTGTPPKSVKKSRSWFFTFNNPQNDDSTSSTSPEQMEHLIRCLDPKLYIFQLERGEEGTPHYQGVVSVKNPIVMPKWLHKGIHWEHAKSLAASINYCQKAETRIGGPWAFNVEVKKPLKIITKLRPWQEDVKAILDVEPDNDCRTIHWWWDEDGGSGKTEMGKFIVTRYNALFLADKVSDAKYAVTQFLKSGKTLHAVVFGFPKGTKPHEIPYSGIEVIKDGLFFSGKYEGCMVVYNRPHVFCFANIPPEASGIEMSRDKWSIRNLGEVNEAWV